MTYGPVPPARRPLLWSLCLGVLGGIALTLGFLGIGRALSQEQASSAIAVLTESLGPLRLTEGRLSHQTVYTPYPTPLARSLRPKILRSRQEDQEGSAASIAQARAFRLLIQNKLDAAIDVLETALRTQPDQADLLSDLSALYGERARAKRQPGDYFLSLENAERAVSLAPAPAEHLFNQALALEHLFLWEDSLQTWYRYLEVDGRSSWAEEAQRHIEGVAAALRRNRARAPSRRISGEIEQGNWRELARITRETPWEARQALEERVLGEWAKAVLQGQWERAARQLEGARRIASLLAASGGDRIFLRIVREMTEATPRSSGPESRAQILYVLSESGDTRLEALVKDARLQEYPSLAARRLYVKAMTDKHDGRLTLALAELRRAHRLSAGHGEKLLATQCEILIAECLQSLGQPAEAWKYRYRALATVSRYPAGEALHGALYSAVLGALGQGHSAAALRLQSRLIQVDQIFPGDRVFRQRLRKARIEAAMGRTEEASLGFKKVVTSLPLGSQELNTLVCQIDITRGEIEDSRSRAIKLSQDWRANTGSNFLGSFDTLADLEFQRCDVERAERRLRQAIDELEQRRARVAPGGYRMSFFDQARPVYERLIALQLNLGAPERALETLETFRSRVLLDRLEELSGRSLRASRGRGARPLDRLRLCSRLPRHTLLVVYDVVDGCLVTWLVARSGIQAVRDHPLWDDISSLVHRLDEPSERSSGSGRETLAKLHGLLVEPWKSSLRPGDRLIFVPTRALFRVPFAALLDPRSGRFLVQDHAIGVAPSASEFLAAYERDRLFSAPPTRVLLVGDLASATADPRLAGRLKGAEREIAGLRRLYRDYETRILRRAGATPERVLTALPGADLVHFGTHARENLEDPSRSALVLARGARGGGSLSAGEILRLRLPRTRLVVLAACDTHSGPLSSSEGPQSIAAAFLGAGVPAVLASLWRVEDESTARFSLRFHRELIRGADALAAIRAAQLAEIETDPRDSTWASFQLVGGVGERSVASPGTARSKSLGAASGAERTGVGPALALPSASLRPSH